MLIVPATSREENRRELTSQLRQPGIPLRLVIQRSRLMLEATTWAEYWQPCRAFFEVDLRLAQRLNRLKKAWLDVLRRPSDRLRQMIYCWRYFGLLHHALQIARDEPWRPHPLLAIRRIVGFESFLLEATGEIGTAACTATSRNPVFLLGRLPAHCAIPTPRHVPLLMPPGQDGLFYHYRQVQISDSPVERILLSPAVDMPLRASSFIPIDRLTRLLSHRADPYWKPRARLLARRVLSPLLQARKDSAVSRDPLCILDLGAGTGQLAAKALTYLRRLTVGPSPPVFFHFVDSAPPSFGRSFGLTRSHAGVMHVEWTTGDYRALADDDLWLQRSGPFDWVFVCRLLDNASNFEIERLEERYDNDNKLSLDVLPHHCLAPRRQPGGVHRLRVSTTRCRIQGGIIYPQFSLRDYFRAILSIRTQTLDRNDDDGWYLPVRRFNPASLITPSGRSLLAQLLKASRVVIIEDLDVEPADLKQHKTQFGLPRTVAIHCSRNAFATEANYYVVAISPEWVRHVRGERLW